MIINSIISNIIMICATLARLKLCSICATPSNSKAIMKISEKIINSVSIRFMFRLINSFNVFYSRNFISSKNQQDYYKEQGCPQQLGKLF